MVFVQIGCEGDSGAEVDDLYAQLLESKVPSAPPKVSERQLGAQGWNFIATSSGCRSTRWGLWMRAQRLFLEISFMGSGRDCGITGLDAPQDILRYQEQMWCSGVG